MNIVIRVDSSLKIGAGHVMRCLTLANSLKQENNNVQFICGDHSGNLIGKIQKQGYFVHILKLKKHSILEEGHNLYYANWLGDTQNNDAKKCLDILKNIRPDWLIVDHYGIDKVWQLQLKDMYTKLMVIDDLADREHYCDLLLDQTFGREALDYKPFVRSDCELLLGPRYAILRPEFNKWRKYSLKRRINCKPRNLLIAMGGIDSDNIIGKILESLREYNLIKKLKITLIVGIEAPHLKNIKKLANSMSSNIDVRVDVHNMAEIMANSDIAIGAAGATTWERCCLGLPSILVVLEKNQEEIASYMSLEGLATKIKPQSLDQLSEHLNFIISNVEIMSKKCAEIATGRGVEKVLKRLIYCI
jgi:UDP-2,4-diacetamido-2,4,6-trideoxy-beta-L-altropyranose hydrolase